MERTDDQNQTEHPVLLQTTVVNESTGQPVYTLIKLPPGTTVECLADILKKDDRLPAVRKEVVTFSERVPPTATDNSERDDDSGRLEIDIAEGAESVEDEASRDVTERVSPAAAERSATTEKKATVQEGRDTLPTPPSSPSPAPSSSAPSSSTPSSSAPSSSAPPAGVGAPFLAAVPETSRAGCHNGHKASILGGRYVLQKTNSRARLTGPFFCNACGLRFDWHSSARMHLNFHNRDFEACDKCQKRQHQHQQQQQQQQRQQRQQQQSSSQPRSCGGGATNASTSGGGGGGNRPAGGGGAGGERNGRPPRCTVCNKSFYLWKTYFEHQGKHKDKVKCPLCCKFFQSLHNVGRHYYDEHSGVQITCNMCGNGYRAFKHYQRHVETMHVIEERSRLVSASSEDGTTPNYSIDLPTLQQLDPSIRVFSSVERTCPVPNCGRVFSTQHTMQRHIYDLHANEMLPCGLCGNAYRTYMQFERHCELFHGENFRIELPVGEIILPHKRHKRESVVSEGGEYMRSIPPLPRSRRQQQKSNRHSSASTSSAPPWSPPAAAATTTTAATAAAATTMTTTTTTTTTTSTTTATATTTLSARGGGRAASEPLESPKTSDSSLRASASTSALEFTAATAAAAAAAAAAVYRHLRKSRSLPRHLEVAGGYLVPPRDEPLDMTLDKPAEPPKYDAILPD